MSVGSRLCCAYVDPKVFCGSLLLVLQVVWCDFLHCSFGCPSRRQRKLIMKEPRLCMSSLSHGPIATWSQSSDPIKSIWAPPWLNRGINSFCHTSFYYDSDKYRAPTSCSAYKSSFHDIFLYSYTDTASVQAVTVAETCINIYRATHSKCSSQYSCAFRESRRQCSRAVRFLELWSRGPEFNLLPNRLQDLSLFVPISNPNTVTLVCSRKFGILNLACHNVKKKKFYFF